MQNNISNNMLTNILNKKLKYIENLKANAKQNIFRDALINNNNNNNKLNIIAEIKRASPSKGKISDITNPAELALNYQKLGASAISVLTDKTGFNGDISDLINVKQALLNNKSYHYCPILRKDFILDKSQILESLKIGADAILLITSILKDKTKELFNYAQELGLEVLIETHTKEEFLYALSLRSPIIGINNRNLNTFDLNPDHALNLINDNQIKIKLNELKKTENYAPILITESGITQKKQLDQAYKNGFNCALIGSSLVNNPDFLRD